MPTVSRPTFVTALPTTLAPAALVLIVALSAMPAFAAPVSWGGVETIDQGDLAVSGGSGSSILILKAPLLMVR
jgi:hypothetical protein